MKNDKPLSAAQELKYRDFVHQYMVHDDPQLAIEASKYYKAKGASARAAGARLLSYPIVQEYLREARDAQKARLTITEDDVVREWARIGMSDIRNYLVWNYDVEAKAHALLVRDSEDLTEDQARAIQEVSIDAEGRIKFKLHAKQPALDSLAKRFGLYKPQEHKVEHYGTILAPATADPSDWQAIVGQHTKEGIGNADSSS